MATNDVTVVLVYGAWADGSSWAKVIAPLAASGVKAVAAPLPLTSFRDDIAALERVEGLFSSPATPTPARSLERPAATRWKRWSMWPRSLPTKARRWPTRRPTSSGAQARAGRAWVDLSARRGLRRRLRAKCFQRRTGSPGGYAAADLAHSYHHQDGAAFVERSAVLVPGRGAGPHDRRRQPSLHGRADESSISFPPRRPHASRDRALDRRRYHRLGDRSGRRLRPLPYSRAKGKAS
jgi:hypothetical protein